MEVKLSKELNAVIEELQNKVKQVTGKQRSKRYLLQNLVDTSLELMNIGCLDIPFDDILKIETDVDSVVCSIVFPQEMANELDRITDEQNQADYEGFNPPAMVTKMQVINAVALAGVVVYAEPYDQLINREKAHLHA